MKFSEAWLREWVNPAIDTNALVEQITMAGLEVDELTPVAGEFSGVVVGQVVDCNQHPNADKLRVTKVDVGQDELIDIVCGAPNCRQGLKVAVAMVGAVLPGDFKIKKAKLRGEPSQGMLCSFSELGLSDESDGIMELPQDAPVGVDLRDYLVLNDHSIEVDLTPNRADCLGIRGLAREVGVLNDMPVQAPAIDAVAATIDDSRAIHLDAPAACPRYLGRVVKNVDMTATTPIWMQEKLRRSGVRSIDPVVDVTNFVLLELGHPMHAFNLDALSGDIHVRHAVQDEALVLLDGNEVKLDEDILVIADSEKPLAMAGVFGGQASGVTATTRDIFLESAFFAPDAIMGKARRYGLHTDASHRYERGVDPQLQRAAMERATALLLDIVGGEPGPVIEAKSDGHIPQPRQVTLRASRLSRVLGVDIDADQVSTLLSRLGLDVSRTEQGWQTLVPAYRFDIAIEEDLIEEVARVYGYNNIPNIAPTARLAMTSANEAHIDKRIFKQTLIDAEFQEAITYSFVDPKLQTQLFPHIQGMTLPHPISVEMSVMRVSLWTGLLSAVSHNQKRQQARVRMFETGLRFVPDDKAEGGVRQEPMIAGVICGRRAEEHWSKDDASVDFYDIKGVVESLLEHTRAGDEFRVQPAKHSALHPGQSAAIYRNGELIGYMGALHPQFEKPFGLNGRTFVFELILKGLTERRLPVAQPVSKFPANRRDIAIVVDEQVNAGEILDCIEKISQNQVVGLNLFDVYRGKGVPEGKKSLAISITLQDTSRTLEEKEIQGMVNDIVNTLSERFAATLRD